MLALRATSSDSQTCLLTANPSMILAANILLVNPIRLDEILFHKLEMNIFLLFSRSLLKMVFFHLYQIAARDQQELTESNNVHKP